jgi:hypothetical protein
MDEVRQDVWVNIDYEEPPPRYRPAQEPVPANEGAPLNSQRPNGDGEQASEPVVAPEPGVKQADGSPSISANQQPEDAQPVAAKPTGEQGYEGGRERERSASVPDPPAMAAALIGDPADAVPEADETVEPDEAADHVGELAGAAVRVCIVASRSRRPFHQFCCSCYKVSGRLRAGSVCMRHFSVLALGLFHASRWMAGCCFSNSLPLPSAPGVRKSAVEPGGAGFRRARAATQAAFQP